MNFEQFREEVRAEFGERMEHVTPEHMRLFLGRIYTKLCGGGGGHQPLTLDAENAANYEQIVADFFARVLDFPREQAIIFLWLFACEMFYSRLGDEYDEVFADLLSLETPE